MEVRVRCPSKHHDHTAATMPVCPDWGLKFELVLITFKLYAAVYLLSLLCPIPLKPRRGLPSFLDLSQSSLAGYPTLYNQTKVSMGNCSLRTVASVELFYFLVYLSNTKNVMGVENSHYPVNMTDEMEDSQHYSI